MTISQNDLKKTTWNIVVNGINSEAKEIATKLNLENRIVVLKRTEAYIKIKDPKDNFKTNAHVD